MGMEVYPRNPVAWLGLMTLAFRSIGCLANDKRKSVSPKNPRSRPQMSGFVHNPKIEKKTIEE